MNEATFNLKQQSKQVEVVKPPQPTDPDVMAILRNIKRQLDTYTPYLEALRTGMPVIGQAQFSGSQSVTVGSATKVALNVLVFSSQTQVDITNNRITVTKNGYYLVNATLGLGSNASDSAYQVLIYQNGASAASVKCELGIVSGGTALPITAVLKLSQGDYIELFGSYSAGSTAFTSASLSIIKLT